jgi:hypothetical protein
LRLFCRYICLCASIWRAISQDNDRRGQVERGFCVLHVTPRERESECLTTTGNLVKDRPTIQTRMVSLLLLFLQVRVGGAGNGQRMIYLPRTIPWPRIRHGRTPAQFAGIAKLLGAVGLGRVISLQKPVANIFLSHSAEQRRYITHHLAQRKLAPGVTRLTDYLPRQQREEGTETYTGCCTWE